VSQNRSANNVKVPKPLFKNKHINIYTICSKYGKKRKTSTAYPIIKNSKLSSIELTAVKGIEKRYKIEKMGKFKY